MGFPCFLVKKLFDIPYVIYCHGSDVYLPWKFKKIISKLVIKNAAAVVVLTNNMKDEIKKNYDRNVLVIPNGIDSEKFKNLSQEKIRDELNIKQNETIIIFIGTLKPVKGVQYLIEAMEILRQKNLDVKLLLIGDGKEKQNLEKLVKKLKLEKHVKFIGKIQNEEIPKYMALSNIFVLPSLSEGFPLTILEAMACGLPIVTTMVRGIPEVVEDGENGFLVEPKNPKEIAEKVLLLLKDDKLREKISNNNKEKAKKYSWENVVEKLEKVYLKVLNKKL
jgi:N-acetyl-alpha-D-glucosaminyl L-malate synthase BshA